MGIRVLSSVHYQKLPLTSSRMAKGSKMLVAAAAVAALCKLQGAFVPAPAGRSHGPSSCEDRRQAHSKAIGSMDGKQVTSLADFTAVNSAIGHMIASAPASKTMDVYNAFCQVQPGQRCWPLHDVQGHSGRRRGRLQGLVGVQGCGEVYSALSCLVTSFLYRPKVYHTLIFLKPCLCCLDFIPDSRQKMQAKLFRH